jgi:hypothetical protein
MSVTRSFRMTDVGDARLQDDIGDDAVSNAAGVLVAPSSRRSVRLNRSTSMAMMPSGPFAKMLANFTSQLTSSHRYDVRVVTRVENVSSSAEMKTINSA